MTPLSVGQHFCLGLVKFIELVHHIDLAEEGPTQTEKTAKKSVLLTRHARAVVTSTDFGFFSLSNVSAVLSCLMAGKVKGICK